MSIYSVTWLFLIFTFDFDISAILFGKDASNRLNFIKFVISRSILVEIETSLALFPKNNFGGHLDFYIQSFHFEISAILFGNDASI